LKIHGLDALNRQMSEASEALKDLDGEIGTVNFNADDPISIEDAIQSMNEMIDAKTARYISNPIIGPLAESMKEKYRIAILEKAAAARLKDGDEDE
jgi:hypothetical protein